MQSYMSNSRLTASCWSKHQTSSGAWPYSLTDTLRCFSPWFHMYGLVPLYQNKHTAVRACCLFSSAQPSALQLKMIMLQHGGRVDNYIHTSTHIICTHLPDTKLKQLVNQRYMTGVWNHRRHPCSFRRERRGGMNMFTPGRCSFGHLKVESEAPLHSTVYLHSGDVCMFLHGSIHAW